ncbi:MAG TPA: TIM-barrel domain-containing protein [Candidatus Acidoferrales bacterium]|nr:TIM-barrel domain-containing protein [Candidatus Acidoferrales bacterium]
MSLTRRAALKTVVSAGAGALLTAQESGIQIAGRPVEVTLTSISPETVRITAQAIEAGQVQPIPSDGALVKEDWGKPVARLRPVAGTRNVKCGDLTVRIAVEPLVIRVETKGGRLIQELKPDAATGALTFQLGDGPVLGLGQGGPQFDRRGNLDRMVSGQGGYHLATHGGKVPIQFAIGLAGWAMFIHQPLGAFDLTGKAGQLQPPNPQAALPLDVFVIGVKDPVRVMAEYAKITGLPEMAPLWSFGYQQSHRTLGPPAEIIQEARLFREKKLPCDAMIYLGTEFCPNGWNTRNGEYDWNSKAFPDPKRAIDELHDAHMKVVLHIVMEGRHYSGTVRDACTAPLPPGRTPDNRWPPDRQVACYWPAHKPLLDLGVDGWWPDQGDGLDPASRLLRNRMYFEGHQMYRPNERVYALHRNSYAGMQRYASFLWSGDIQSTWETLKTHVPVAVNTGLSGIPYWGTDIGGFVPTQDFTGELYVRWFQFAAFNPLFRSHGREWKLRLPWGWNRGEIGDFRETPSYHPAESELHNAAVEPICKKYLELRYQLMPYLYSAVKESCETGLPIIRALWLHYPEDAVAAARGDQYLYGRDILVAPVVEKGATSRTLYLPRGTWYDFWTRQKLEGGREITRPVDLETTPLYVRAGAVIPMGPVKQYTAEKVDGPLSLWVHPGADGAFSWYEDDGKTFDYRKGEFMRVNISWNDRQRRLSLRLAGGSKMLEPAKRNIVVHVAGEPVTREMTREVSFTGRPLDVKL